MTQLLTDRIFAARFKHVLTREENAVLEVLEEHEGRESAIKQADVSAKVQSIVGRWIGRREFSQLVVDLLDKGIPIGTAKGAPQGYFLVGCDEDRESAALEHAKQGIAQLRRARLLSPRTNFGRELLGQLAVEFQEEAA